MKALRVMLLCLMPLTGLADHNDNGNDDSNQADLMASCNAQFHRDCPIEYTEQVAAESHAAPAGDWFSSRTEVVTMALLALITLKLRRRGRSPRRVECEEPRPLA